MIGWKRFICLIVILIRIDGFAMALSDSPESCQMALGHDPRFHWADDLAPMFGVGDPSRLPPDLFGSRIAALSAPIVRGLPTGLTLGQEKFFSGVWNLLRDRIRVLELTRTVVREIDAMSDVMKFGRREAFLNILSQWEAKYGFPLLEVDGYLSSQDWLAQIERGVIIDDTNAGKGAVVLRVGGIVEPIVGHWNHGRDSHRFQWHLVLRDLELRPDHYGRPSDIVQMYKDLALGEHLDWTQTGVAGEEKNLFRILFDTAENNPSSPGYFTEYRESYWPELPIE